MCEFMSEGATSTEGINELTSKEIIEAMSHEDKLDILFLVTSQGNKLVKTGNCMFELKLTLLLR